jgi:hypothetical protein
MCGEMLPENGAGFLAYLSVEIGSKKIPDHVAGDLRHVS